MPTAAVLGAGIAGLSSAIALIRAGWSVAIYERADQLVPMGAAISLWSNAYAALNQLGIADHVFALGQPFETMLLAEPNGRAIMGPMATHGPAIIITRSALQTALLDALPSDVLHLGMSVSRIDQASIRFTNGTMAHADLIIDAGGIKSIGTGREPRHCGYGGVVALSDAVDGEGLGGMAAEYWGWGERFGLFELPDQRRYWFYMRDQDADSTAPTHSEITARCSGWSAPIAKAIAATPADRLIPFSIHAAPPPTSYGSGRILHVGDAAHPMQPNLGQGACQALEDAAALYEIARTATPVDIVPRMATARLKRVAMIVNRSAEAQHGAHGFRPKQWLVRNAMRAIPVAITSRVTRSVQTLS